MADSRASKTVLVTGANSGLGLATALAVAKRGYTVVGSVRSEAKGDDLHKAAAEAGVPMQHVVFDVTDADAGAAAMEAVGPLYGLVNNAGGGGTGAIEDVDDEFARHTLETMVVAPMRLARLALPGMRAAGTGRIINISSIYGRTSTPLTGWYQAAKQALEGVSDALRMEVAGAGIKVVLVEPGLFRTAIFGESQKLHEAHEGSRFESAYERMAQTSKLSEPMMGDPKQVAGVVVSCLDNRSPRDRYLVGMDAIALNALERAVPFIPRAVVDRMARLSMGL